LSDYVWHFTRRDKDPVGTLRAIIETGKVIGGQDKYCPHRSACFTEVPLPEIIRQSPVLDEFSYTRLSDYGIGFKKQWIFDKGGRPVIYCPTIEAELLPDSLKWRHCELDYNAGRDFTWQREWRVLGDVAFGSDDDVVFVVPSFDIGMDLLCTGGGHCQKHDEWFVELAYPFICLEALSGENEPIQVDTFMNRGD
ncbi:MAG: hypothetical protein KDA89_12695, partial [Planctomycetaceae bacterium]|nr:hypothetical protein [Planctomycetaceae bacterium]